MIFRSSSGSFNTFIKLNWTVLRNFLKLIEVITSTMFWKKMLLLNCSVPPNSKNASGKRQNCWGKKWTRSWSSTCFWLLKIFNCFSSFESIGEVVCICILILKVKEANLLPTGAHTHRWRKSMEAGSSKVCTPNSRSCHKRPAAFPKCGDTRGMGRARASSLFRKISCSASLQHLINHKKFIAVYTPVPETLSPN